MKLFHSINYYAGPDAVLIYSDRRDIRQYNLRTKDGATVVSDLTNAIGIDFHWQEHVVYWSDVNDDKIERVNFNGSNREVIIETGLLAPEGKVILYFIAFLAKVLFP